MGLRINRQPRIGDRTGVLWRKQAQARAAEVKAEREAADAQSAAEAAYEQSMRGVEICLVHHRGSGVPVPECGRCNASDEERE